MRLESGNNMSVESNLRTLTLQNAAIVALIGSRFHIDHIPDTATYPLVRAQLITDPFSRTHSGTFGGRALVQLDVFDDDQSGRDAASDALIAWLDNYNGAMGSYNVTIQVKDRRGNWEAESRLYRRLLEVEILYLKV